MYFGQEHFIKEHTKCPPVHRSTILLFLQNLWRDELGGAAKGVGLFIRTAQRLAETIVSNANVTVCAEEDVVEFQVTAKGRVQLINKKKKKRFSLNYR